MLKMRVSVMEFGRFTGAHTGALRKAKAHSMVIILHECEGKQSKNREPARPDHSLHRE